MNNIESDARYAVYLARSSVVSAAPLHAEAAERNLADADSTFDPASSQACLRVLKHAWVSLVASVGCHSASTRWTRERLSHWTRVESASENVRVAKAAFVASKNTTTRTALKIAMVGFYFANRPADDAPRPEVWP